MVLEDRPATFFWNPKDVLGAVLIRVFRIGSLSLRSYQFGVLGLECVRNVLEEDQAQDDMLVLRRVPVVTYFFPVGDGIREIVAEWVRFLREEKLWGNDDPLFPSTRVAIGASQQFEAVGFDRKHWSTATPIRGIFREAFERAGLPYFNPHSVRKTLALLGQRACKTPEDYKAWSQNLGHEQVLTTFMSYGTVQQDRQGEIIRGLKTAGQTKSPDADGIAEALLRRLRSECAGFPAL